MDATGMKRGTRKLPEAAVSTTLTEAESIDLIADILLELALTGEADGTSSTA